MIATATVCSCGLPMWRTPTSVNICDHCDRECLIRMRRGRCARCDQPNKKS